MYVAAARWHPDHRRCFSEIAGGIGDPILDGVDAPGVLAAGAALSTQRKQAVVCAKRSSQDIRALVTEAEEPAGWFVTDDRDQRHIRIRIALIRNSDGCVHIVELVIR